MSKARRHHIVPASHLKRFADANGRVRVRKRDDLDNGFVTGVINVAVERDFYAVEYADEWSDDVEKLLAELDGQGSASIERIIAGPFPPADQDQISIANYVALQWLRGQDHRGFFGNVLVQQRKLELMNLPRETVRRGLQETQGLPPTDEEIDELIDYLADPTNYDEDFEPHQNHSIAMMLKALPDVGDVLLSKKWLLLTATEGVFLTSDAPVTLFTPRERCNPFFGLGIGTAEEVCFAVSRQQALMFLSDQRAIERTVDVGMKFVDEINRRTAASGVRWVIHHPDEDPLRDLVLLPGAPKWETSIPGQRTVD